MFIKYQKVRNRVMGTIAVIGATVAAIFGYQSMGNSHRAEPIVAAHGAAGEWADPVVQTGPSIADSQTPATASGLVSNALQPPRQSPVQSPQRKALTTNDRYVAAMELAGSRAASSGKAKDALGSSSLWKLNLYDDDRNGVWDRAKLDTNRDEVDDEKWTFKNGRWEKENGQLVWSSDQWVKATSLVQADNRSTDPMLARYRSAMKVAMSRANSSGKGKDVLGESSSWKLNLYDDDRDGTWDRAKLDTNRDAVDEEKWTFKNGRWEKNEGRLVWSDSRWIASGEMSKAIRTSSDPSLARYVAAMEIAIGRANSSGKGKDVLGESSPWKLNFYDDDRDGTWDRAKLDTNRDEVDDEKWTFKNGRWEKNSGQMVWLDGNWKSTSSIEQSASHSADPNLVRYRAAMKIATGKANRSGKGKDVLGSRSPWKLNLYDDNKDGIWDRAKLDANRDEVDDEKWNFKQGRWEKDGGAKTWDGKNWISE